MEEAESVLEPDLSLIIIRIVLVGRTETITKRMLRKRQISMRIHFISVLVSLVVE